ncbi:MAG TPA: CocE/NonD family hydrolase [Candidatus Acidoferrales bacterium]|nr:CocE/NonD family hydrolase [Candidatus Acidoferrales bacterium]
MRISSVSRSLIAVLFCVSALGSAQAQQQPAPNPAAAAKPSSEQMVAMRDGVKLATDVYLPEGTGPWPVVLTRTPYGKDTMGPPSSKLWTEHRYAFVIQDCRGRFKSEGVDHPFMNDHTDGYDTIEWIAKQPWSNGKVGMVGASAMGITANQASIMNPPHLTAMYVIVAPSSAYSQTVFIGGAFRKEMNEGWLKAQHDEAAIKDTLSHNVYDHFYDIREESRFWEKVTVPVYNQGGWYDIFEQGNINNFAGLQSEGGGLAAGNQKLILGPWGHGRLEEVKYPENSGAGIGGKMTSDLELRWFDYWLKGLQNGIMDEPPVRYYVMGDVTDLKAPGNEWRTAESWPPPAKTTSYFLTAGGGLSENLPAAQESVDSYQYDPKNPVPTIGGANLFSKKGPMDQRETGERKDVLKFATAPLKAPVEVTGPVTVELWAESDAPDTDFMAKLVDVYPDGTERLVLDSAVRARFREGPDREVMMKKGEVYKFRLNLWSTSLVFNAGHRIAIHVTSSNDPRFDPNPNTGHPLHTDDDTRIATNTIHHDRAHPSRALLPIVEAYPAAGSLSSGNR